MATRKNEPLSIVRNIVAEIDAEINSLNGTIDYLQKEKQNGLTDDEFELNESQLVEYNSFLRVMKNLRDFVIYKA